MIVPAKPFWTSKRFWLNVAALAVVVLTQVTQTFSLPPTIAGYFGSIVAFLNLLLLPVTDKPVTTGAHTKDVSS